jgi:hypothetical protein
VASACNLRESVADWARAAQDETALWVSVIDSIHAELILTASSPIPRYGTATICGFIRLRVIACNGIVIAVHEAWTMCSYKDVCSEDLSGYKLVLYHVRLRYIIIACYLRAIYAGEIC